MNWSANEFQCGLYYHYHHLLIRVFHISVSWWSSTEDWVTASLLKSPQVARTLLSVLTIFNNAIVWIVSTRPPTSKSSRPFNNPLVSVPKAQITIGIIVTFMFHSFFNSLAKLLLLLLLLLFTPWEFFTSVLADGLSLEFEWQQVSRTLISILAVPNNVLVWMISTRPLISKSSSFFNNPLVTVPKAPITSGIIVTFMFHSVTWYATERGKVRSISLTLLCLN